ncbi:MAG: hypothetical protein PHU99_02555 [Candidatus Cloacimonetes bacterium]|jgi:hypothetical protein|nr:hypothetical protein [Candidatus Cloacimonadota bacterium]MDY0336363.1 hypothetical protein [Candidatus Cloacimonadaceae bacterium]MCK9335688.1 hypothetical protein [Candidatus Cloacimonadota bacterium]MDD2543214.1 hypothetical protein [Candidatus Cloacimonadota bacterium]MDD2683187.1 hypothetical protein [Candidatus Cloacimonadota bacterium]
MLIILMALFALSACELFELRDSDPPTEGAPWNDPASEVELALQNLEYTYEDSRNAVNYSRLFQEDYSFYFAAQDITDYSTDSQWNRNQEQDMLLNLHSRYSSITIQLDSLHTSDEISANEAKIYRNYTVKARPIDSTNTIDLAMGNMELHYRRLYGRWYIYKWYDYRSGNQPTWGLMKYENG